MQMAHRVYRDYVAGLLSILGKFADPRMTPPTPCEKLLEFGMRRTISVDTGTARLYLQVVCVVSRLFLCFGGTSNN